MTVKTSQKTKSESIKNDYLYPLIHNHGTLVLFSGLIVMWQFISLFFEPTRFPGVVDIFEGVLLIYEGSVQYSFWEHAPMTFFRIISAAIIAMMIGIPIGIVMGSNEQLTNFLNFYLLILLAVPSIMWAFLSITWFGLTTYLVPLLATVLALLPYVIINIWKGTEAVNENLIEMSSVFNVSSSSVWRQVYIPHLTPFIFSTTRMLFSLSWRIMLVVEIFGTQRGIGFAINSYFISQENNMLLAWTIPMLFLLFGLERLLQRIETKKFAWRDVETEETSVGA